VKECVRKADIERILVLHSWGKSKETLPFGSSRSMLFGRDEIYSADLTIGSLRIRVSGISVDR
jgi:hypothetical protein